MRKLVHRTRSEVAKESIIRLCEAINIDRKTEKKRSDEIRGMLEDEPNLMHSGADVQLCVTSTHLNVISRETQKIIIQHEMPNVSFASSGDEDTGDFVAYVAKDLKFGRACFVLECGYDTAKSVLENIAQAFQLRIQQIHRCTLSRNSSSVNHDRIPNSNDTLRLTESHDNSYDQSYRINNENQHGNDIVALTRASLEREPWYHGSYLTREESETRLKHDGDFLVRESMLEEGNFVLSVMHYGVKLHLLFDSIDQVRTREMKFDNISHLVRYHHDEGSPIVVDRRIVYLLNGVRPRYTRD